MASLPKRSVAAPVSAAVPAPSAVTNSTAATPAAPAVSTPALASAAAGSAAPAVVGLAPAAAPAGPLTTETPFAVCERELVAYLENNMEVVKRVSPELGEKAVRAAIDYVSDRRNPDQWIPLVRSEPSTVLDSVRKLAALGLTVSQDGGTAFLIPRTNKGKLICTPVPGVRGFETVILSNCPKATIETGVIRDQDIIDVTEGTEPHLNFRRNFRPDRSKENPIIGAYCVIREQPGQSRVQLKTIGIYEAKKAHPTDPKKEITTYTTHDDRTIEVGRMGAESACRYVAQRACMREVARTWLKGNASVEALLQMEDLHFRQGDEVQGSPRLTRDRGPKLELVPTKGPMALPAPQEITVGAEAPASTTAAAVAV